MRRLILATRNPHKVREFARLLGGHFAVEPLPDYVSLPPETGRTFQDNALIKARAAAKVTRADVIADDSGIESEHLGGRPGVYSARYAGPGASDADNLLKLREEVPAGTGLRYVCVVAFVTAGAQREDVFVGRCEGTMATAPRGEGGFGYDPVFIPVDDPQGRTMAELADAEKDRISHRGRAARALRDHLLGVSAG